MTTTRKLRLGPLPRTETVKLTFTCPTNLKADLERYAALHAETYGEPVDVVTLIPHMLAAFMARDRGFKSRGTSVAKPVASKSEFHQGTLAKPPK
ncbi:DUF2274 domain-containing protein [Salinisphaera hydrothermalis]|uniref:DUF2274 domain-containing protein n=1 Tax=Salinisphaera hydrothermalis TaxID=563188 RepID=UPI00334195D2